MQTNEKFAWAVVGAGPAGIAAVGKLLDQGIPSKEIIWIDPYFRVGDFGSKWSNVSSNTRVKLFTQFLMNCQSFDYAKSMHQFDLHQLNPEETCQLAFMVEPLQWVTEQLKQKISWLTNTVNKIYLTDRQWHIQLAHSTIVSTNVILAIGAEAKTLNYPNLTVIPLDCALDNQKLPAVCDSNDTVAVFGSSHSAIMIIRHLLNCQVKKVINFYRQPLRYAVYFDDWILFDDTGLKGGTAQWARENIDDKSPANLERYLATEEHIQQYLPDCNKVVYAVGFAARNSIIIEDFPEYSYDEHTGVIAPGLFGLGIAFPEANIDPLGNQSYRVGLWKFMDYLNRVMPIWLKDSSQEESFKKATSSVLSE